MFRLFIIMKHLNKSNLASLKEAICKNKKE